MSGVDLLIRFATMYFIAFIVLMLCIGGYYFWKGLRGEKP